MIARGKGYRDASERVDGYDGSRHDRLASDELTCWWKHRRIVGIKPEIRAPVLRLGRRQVEPPEHAVAVANEGSVRHGSGLSRKDDRLTNHGCVEMSEPRRITHAAEDRDGAVGVGSERPHNLAGFEKDDRNRSRGAGGPALHRRSRWKTGVDERRGSLLRTRTRRRSATLTSGKDCHRVLHRLRAAWWGEIERCDHGRAALRSKQRVARIVRRELPQKPRS